MTPLTLGAITFASPWALVALAGLPVLWFLLRITPPSPRTEVFPAVRMLLGLRAGEETPARTPLWLLLLRVGAAALVILGLARPVLDAAGGLPGQGTLLIVVDDGWAAAPDWSRRLAGGMALLDRAERDGRRVALLTTAPDESGAAPVATAAMPAAELRPRLAALRPKPWAVDRAASATAIAGFAARGPGAAAYLADGLGGPEFPAFAKALESLSAVRVLAPENPPRLLLPPRSEADRLVARVAGVAQPLPTTVAVLAQAGDGRTLARAEARFEPGAEIAEAGIALPPELRNRLARLVLEGAPSAGSVVLLDERWRRRPVGVLAGDAAAETPLSGAIYYVRRALDPYAELREGSFEQLLAREISVLILADRVVSDGPEAEALRKFVEKGGLLLRFAGPQTAEHPDALLPVKLLAADRQLGGAMSWSQPAGLAPFPAGSPFQGLAIPADVRVTRQVLAEPGARLAEQTWASLADGTPLVTTATIGAGRVVLFHVTANADWSDLPLSGLFVEMLRRCVGLSVGVTGGEEEAGRRLAPFETLDGFGQPGKPPGSAQAVLAGQIAETAAAPRSPPGLYGPESGRRALNLSARATLPQPAGAILGAQTEGFAGAAPERVLAPWLLAAALAILALDLLISLPLRGLLRAAAVLLALSAPAIAQERDAALATRLAYVVTNDAQVDQVSRMGLAGLSDFVTRRTAATLSDPAGVVPGRDDLAFYPLLYWPITPDAEPPDGAAIAALNDYMAHGGIILIDTRNGGSGEGFADGADAALTRIAKGLAVPPLTALTPTHVLGRAFYLLQDFPGRFTGDTVWVQRDQDRSNDSVSPVIIGGHDWAAAWAVDAQGRNPYATIPGGARQRTLAYRFGVNLVMYALTGNYKGDQVHIPAILERLGQ